MSMSQFYVEIEGLWFDPKIKNIWESAFWIWHFYYQHRLVVSDLLLMTIKNFSRHWGTSAYYLGFQAPHYFLRTQLQQYILISGSVGVWSPWWWPCCSSSKRCPSTPSPCLRHQSGGGGDPVRSCPDHCLVSPSDVHILDIPQTQSIHTRTKTYADVLVCLSSCQYNAGR